MKYRKILICMTVLVCLAFQACAQPVSDIQTNTMGSSGDYLSPNTISNGYSYNFPWYSAGGSFYNQGVPDTTFWPFKEYYTTTGAAVVGGIISNPTKFDIAQRTPSRIYYGTGQALPYNQYVSTVPSGTNELWVQGATNWTQYVVSPVGTWIQLVANAPVGGPGGFYEIVQTDTSTVKYNTYQFNQGYNTMNFNADQVGRHMLYFVVNNQPSNVVIVDVFAQAQPETAAGGIVPNTGQSPPIVIGVNGQNHYTSTSLTSNGQTTTTSDGTTTVTSSREFHVSSSSS